jgi:hypothetical protein
MYIDYVFNTQHVTLIPYISDHSQVAFTFIEVRSELWSKMWMKQM